MEPLPIGPTETRVAWELVAIPSTTEEHAPPGFAVVVSFSTLLGVSTFFFPVDQAVILGRGIFEAGIAGQEQAAAQPGRIIVPDVDVSAVLRSIGNGNRKGGKA
jgi:hypothetical protein